MSVIGWPVGPAPSPGELDVVGDMAVSQSTGKNIGYRITSTSLAGSWMGNSRSMQIQPPQTLGDNSSGRFVQNAGHGQMWFFMNEDGTFDAYADGNRDGGKIIRGDKFSGRIFKMTDFAFNLVNGVEGEAGWGEIYYPVFVNPARDQSTIFLLDSSVVFGTGENATCSERGQFFVEQQWFVKISNEVDLDIMRDVRAFSDQWLWQPQPEDGPLPGERYPDTCP